MIISVEYGCLGKKNVYEDNLKKNPSPNFMPANKIKIELNYQLFLIKFFILKRNMARVEIGFNVNNIMW